MTEYSAAIESVIAERKKQVEQGKTPEDDLAYNGRGVLAQAGASLALYPDRLTTAQSIWPWAHYQRKQYPERVRLVKAAALIIAEIERLDCSNNT